MQKARVLVVEKDLYFGLILKDILDRELHHISMVIGTVEKRKPEKKIPYLYTLSGVQQSRLQWQTRASDCREMEF